jgi:hypothetical protein
MLPVRPTEQAIAGVSLDRRDEILGSAARDTGNAVGTLDPRTLT